MTTIHIRRDGPAYRAWIDGQHDWCYGWGTTWQAAAVNLMQSFESTLGLGIRIDHTIGTELTDDQSDGFRSMMHEVKPLDGLAAENAREHVDCSPEPPQKPEWAPAYVLFNKDGTVHEDPELAERAADWNVP